MISTDVLENTIPYPIKLEIHAYTMINTKDKLEQVLYEIINIHNKKYNSKIESIKIQLDDKLEEYFFIDAGVFYKIYIGKNLVHEYNCPISIINNNITSFLDYIVDIIKVILFENNDRIIKIQEQNKLKLKQFENEGYYEMPFAYYYNLSDNRYFYYLKKLVKRYPNITRFKQQLRIIYNNKKKFTLVKKMKNNNNNKTF